LWRYFAAVNLGFGAGVVLSVQLAFRPDVGWAWLRVLPGLLGWVLAGLSFVHRVLLLVFIGFSYWLREDLQSGCL
jgi:hypothetical protein